MCLCSLEQLNHNLLELSNKDNTQRKLQRVLPNRNLDVDEDEAVDHPEQGFTLQMIREIIFVCFEYKEPSVLSLFNSFLNFTENTKYFL